MKRNIVLLHGWGASAYKLKPLSSFLTKLGWKTLVLKLPGFDLKEPHEVWGLNEYASFVLSKGEKKFKQKYFIFGHSFGGRIAAKIAHQSGSDINGAVFCAASGVSRGNVIKRAAFGILAKVGKGLLSSQDSRRLYSKVLYKFAREHDYEKANSRMKEIFKKILTEDIKKGLPHTTIPVLILWGLKDKMTPFKDALFIKRVTKKSVLVTFPNEGHRLPYTRPFEIAQEIEKWYQNLN